MKSIWRGVGNVKAHLELVLPRLGSWGWVEEIDSEDL